MQGIVPTDQKRTELVWKDLMETSRDICRTLRRQRKGGSDSSDARTARKIVAIDRIATTCGKPGIPP